MNKSILAAAITIGATVMAAPAMAGTNQLGSGQGQSIEIEYKDLNLSSAKGQKRLERRIDAAARKVCGIGQSRTGTRMPSAANRQCFAKARKSARSQMASVMGNKQRGG